VTLCPLDGLLNRKVFAMIFGLEWQCWAAFVVVLIVIAIFGSRDEKRRSERRAFYRERQRQYDDALPDRYPYIAGWDGVDPDDMAIVKKGDRHYRHWGMMPMSEAKKKMPIHPATGLNPDVDATPYVGDGYRSVNQMKRK